MAVRDIIQAAGGSAATSSAVYVEDVFSTYLYTGTGASQTITNGIDLSTKGGLVWIKRRTDTVGHALFDTIRGSGNIITTNTSGTQSTGWTDLLTGFNTNGFNLGADPLLGYVNTSSASYASWTFRKQAKFFDVVTYTGNGSARTISHALGATPGMIIVKRTNVTGDWQVYHKSLTSAGYSIQLNLLNAQSSATTVWNSTAPTSSVFSVGTDASVNASGGTYIAYLFADSNSGGFGAAGTDSVVACGSFTAAGAASINLGWEPQFVLCKNRGTAQNWLMFDDMRGFNQSSGNIVNPNTSDAEVDNFPGTFYPTATGFYNDALTGTYIYLAIRRGPMKTPTDATKVFAPAIGVNASTGSVDAFTSGFPVDMYIEGRTYNGLTVDRLRGGGTFLYTKDSTTEQTVASYRLLDSNTGVRSGNPYNWSAMNAWMFRRAPGFFDIVCYTGNSSARTVAHNLCVVPELYFVKQRSGGSYNTGWASGGTVYADPALYTPYLNSNQAQSAFATNWTTPTSTTFGISASGYPNDSTWNYSGAKYVAYLFASCPGVSKVGSYTGSGTTKQIDCGFAAGARFVMIKRMDDTGDWYVWDTARGIVSGNDPYLLMNSTAAEVTNTDYIDPYSAGFEISSSAPAAINASGGTFIYLAIA